MRWRDSAGPGELIGLWRRTRGWASSTISWPTETRRWRTTLSPPSRRYERTPFTLPPPNHHDHQPPATMARSHHLSGQVLLSAGGPSVTRTLAMHLFSRVSEFNPWAMCLVLQIVFPLLPSRPPVCVSHVFLLLFVVIYYSFVICFLFRNSDNHFCLVAIGAAAFAHRGRSVRYLERARGPTEAQQPDRRLRRPAGLPPPHRRTPAPSSPFPPFPRVDSDIVVALVSYQSCGGCRHA